MTYLDDKEVNDLFNPYLQVLQHLLIEKPFNWIKKMLTTLFEQRIFDLPVHVSFIDKKRKLNVNDE